MDGGAWWAAVHRSRRVRHDGATSLSLFTFKHWRRKWQPPPVFLPGESQGRGEPGGLPSMGSHRVGHDLSDLAAAGAAADYQTRTAQDPTPTATPRGNKRNGNSISSVQSLSPGWLIVTPWTAARQASLSITNSQSLLNLMSTASVMPSNHVILCRPLLPPSIFPGIRVFSNVSVLHIRWAKCWSFSFSISPSNEYSLISFRMDWLDLLAVQGTLKSLLQHHSSKA